MTEIAVELFLAMEIFSTKDQLQIVMLSLTKQLS